MKKEESDIIWMFIIAIAGAVLICLAFSYFSEKRLDNSETIEASGIEDATSHIRDEKLNELGI